MRPGQNNFKNRNRNRNRRHGGGGGGGGGGGNPGNRVLDSNGPDVKLRGTAQTIAEKYMQLARDAASAGDRVMAESYYQHADHYYRLWLAAQPAGQPIQFSRRLDEDVEDLDGTEGEEDAAEAADGAEAADAAPASGEAHAAEGDDPALGAVLLRQIEHHLVDRRAVGLGPGTVCNLHLPCLAETQLMADWHHDDFTIAHAVAITHRVHMPLAMPAHRLRQTGLEAGIDVLGIDKPDRQTTRQDIEESLDRRRATQ